MTSEDLRVYVYLFAGIILFVEGFEVVFCKECRNSLASLQKLKDSVQGILKDKVWNAKRSHERIKIGISACPNACSAPQIKDFGAIAFIKPRVNEDACNSCKACLKACKEGAIEFSELPRFNENCVGCGDCVRACKRRAIEGEVLFRVMAGGKLGRHPKFAEVVAIVRSEESVAKILEKVLEISYERGVRFSYVRDGIKMLKEEISTLSECNGLNR